MNYNRVLFPNLQKAVQMKRANNQIDFRFG